MTIKRIPLDVWGMLVLAPWLAPHQEQVGRAGADYQAVMPQAPQVEARRSPEMLLLMLRLLSLMCLASASLGQTEGWIRAYLGRHWRCIS
jgi:hypothetical protein